VCVCVFVRVCVCVCVHVCGGAVSKNSRTHTHTVKHPHSDTSQLLPIHGELTMCVERGNSARRNGGRNCGSSPNPSAYWLIMTSSKRGNEDGSRIVACPEKSRVRLKAFHCSILVATTHGVPRAHDTSGEFIGMLWLLSLISPSPSIYLSRR